GFPGWGLGSFRTLSRLSCFPADEFASAALGLNFRFGRGAEGVCAHGEFLAQLAITQNLDATRASIREADRAQRGLVDACAVLETVKRFEVDWQVSSTVAGIIKAAFRNAPNQRHLAALEANPDRTSGASGLAFPTASAGFAMAAGFALAKAFATVLGAGAG